MTYLWEVSRAKTIRLPLRLAVRAASRARRERRSQISNDRPRPVIPIYTIDTLSIVVSRQSPASQKSIYLNYAFQNSSHKIGSYKFQRAGRFSGNIHLCNAALHELQIMNRAKRARRKPIKNYELRIKN